MKKFLKVFVLLLICMPVMVTAKTYKVNSDLSISIDDSEWYVFTRNNIEDNEELTNLGITYDYINNLFNSNYMYLDALLLYKDSDDYIELFVRIKENSTVKNFTNYNDNDLMEFSKALSEKTGATNYDIYKNKYKFAYSTYFDKSVNYYVDEYYTIVDGIGYTVTAEKPNEFDESERQRIRNIVDTIEFKNAKTLKENFDIQFGETMIIIIVSAAFNFMRVIVAIIIIIREGNKNKVN